MLLASDTDLVNIMQGKCFVTKKDLENKTYRFFSEIIAEIQAYLLLETTELDVCAQRVKFITF